MTDLLILPDPGYSEGCLFGYFRTSNHALDSFKQQRLRYTKNLIIDLLIINSLKDKLTYFKDLILNKADVFFITERKVDNFQMLSFKLKHTVFFLGTEKKIDGEIMISVKEDF